MLFKKLGSCSFKVSQVVGIIDDAAAVGVFIINTNVHHFGRGARGYLSYKFNVGNFGSEASPTPVSLATISWS